MVSKPVAPPWNDSSKNLVRDIARNLRRHEAILMTHAGRGPELDAIASAPVYPAKRARFAPALADNARVLAHLIAGRGYDAWHFFFAPNPRTSLVGRLAARVRRMPTLQTVCSAPAAGSDLRALLFADRNVVLSKYTESLALRAGVDPAKLRCIPPAVAPLERMPDEAVSKIRVELDLRPERALIVYPGDLEFSSAAELSLRAFAELRSGHDATLVLACRKKTAAAHAHEQRLRALARELGIEQDIAWLDETARIHELLAVADVVALPAETLYAKMDLPLVLIEAMWLARPVVVAEATPASELAEGGAALAVAPQVASLAHALDRLLSSPSARLELGARARATAQARFHPAHVAAAYEALYDELLE